MSIRDPRVSTFPAEAGSISRLARSPSYALRVMVCGFIVHHGIMLILPEIPTDFLQVSAAFIGDHIEKSGRFSHPKREYPQFSDLLSAGVDDFHRRSSSFVPIVPARHTSELKSRCICFNS
jgi:hypothetical protein